MSRAGKAAVGPLLGYLRRLRFPWLFAVTAALFLADLAVPDLIPFADEILLGLLATLLGVIRTSRRERRGDSAPLTPREPPTSNPSR